jgi:hypothetical protein
MAIRTKKASGKRSTSREQDEELEGLLRRAAALFGRPKRRATPRKKKKTQKKKGLTSK